MRILTPVVIGVAFFLAPWVSGQEPKQKDKATPHSKLYTQFDPGSLRKKSEPHFDRFFGAGTRELEFTHLPDKFKLFDIEGNTPEEKLKKLLAQLKIEFRALAKASGVQIIHDPKDYVEERPIALLQAMYYGQKIKLGSLRGFYFTYKDGKTTGAVDVFAALRSDTDNYWQIVCAVHDVISSESPPRVITKLGEHPLFDGKAIVNASENNNKLHIHVVVSDRNGMEKLTLADGVEKRGTAWAVIVASERQVWGLCLPSAPADWVLLEYRNESTEKAGKPIRKLHTGPGIIKLLPKPALDHLPEEIRAKLKNEGSR